MNQKVTPQDVKQPGPASAGPQPGTAVDTPKTTAVVNWQDQMEREAKEASQQERAAASSISLRAGVISYQGNPVPNNKLQVVILDSCLERSLYEGSFDPDNIRSPVCYALAKSSIRDNKWGFYDVKPADNVMKRQNETCEGCPKDKWGSQIKDGKPAKGKACQERRRLLLIPAREAEQLQPENILSAEVALLRMPVTSVRFWGQFVNNCAALMGRPPHGIITEISTAPDIKHQFNVTFQAKTKLPDDSLAAISKKREMVQSILMKGYDPQEEKEVREPSTGPKKY